MGTREAHSNYVINHTAVIKPKYRQVTEGRGVNFAYYCLKNLSDFGSLNKDMQGKHASESSIFLDANHPKVSEELKTFG